MEHFFDTLLWYDARVYALRAYLILLLRRVMGFGYDEIQAFFEALIIRYNGLKKYFHDELDKDETLCVIDGRGTPTCQHCFQSINLETTMAATNFRAMPLALQHTLLQDYVEEISGQVVGVNRVLSFWERCFNRQKLFTTKMGTEEHERLWTRND